jgi:hypothetical protein
MPKTELPTIAEIPAVGGCPPMRVVGKPAEPTAWIDNHNGRVSPLPSEAPPPPLGPDWQPAGGE